MPGPSRPECRTVLASTVMSDLIFARRRVCAARLYNRRMSRCTQTTTNRHPPLFPSEDDVLDDLQFTHVTGPAFPIATDLRAWPLSYAVEAKRVADVSEPAPAEASVEAEPHNEGRRSMEFPVAVNRRIAPRSTHMPARGIVRTPRHLRKTISFDDKALRVFDVQVPRPTADVPDVDAKVSNIIALQLSEQTRTTVSVDVLISAVHRLLEGIRSECGAVLPGHLFSIERAVTQDPGLCERVLHGVDADRLLALALKPAVPRWAG